MDNYINKAVLEFEKSLNGGSYRRNAIKLFGGVKSGAIAPTDNLALKKAIEYTRAAVAAMDNDKPLLSIGENIDKFKFERYFNEFVNSINNIIESYINGSLNSKQANNVLQNYNTLVSYLYNVLHLRDLNETERYNIDGEFINILPQLTQLIDIAETEKFVDTNKLKELYTQIQTKNYVNIKISNYEKKLKEKVPLYEFKKGAEVDINDLLNQIYDDIDNGVISLNKDVNKIITEIKLKQKEHKQLLKKSVKENEPSKQKRILKQLQILTDDSYALYNEIKKNTEFEADPFVGYSEEDKLKLNDIVDNKIKSHSSRNPRRATVLKFINEAKKQLQEGESAPLESRYEGTVLPSGEVVPIDETVTEPVVPIRPSQKQIDDAKTAKFNELQGARKDKRSRAANEVNDKKAADEYVKKFFGLGRRKLIKHKKFVKGGMKIPKVFKFTKKMIETPSQAIYDAMQMENTKKIYGYGNKKKSKSSTNFNPYENNFKPYPILFDGDKFDKPVKLSKKN